MDKDIYGKIKSFFAQLKALVLLFLLLSGCAKNTHPKPSDLPEVNLRFIRFEQLFFGKENIPLQHLKKTYPYFFPEATPDSIWHNKRKDSLQLALFQATQTLKSDDLRQRITAVLQHVKFYFPETPMPKKAITLLTDVDYSLRAVDADSLLLLSIDTYLGSTHQLYEGIPLYIKQTLQSAYIESELVDALAPRFVPKSPGRSFLAQMIAHGKRLLLHDYFLPHLAQKNHLQYTTEQWDWAMAHEEEVWDYFIANELLFSTSDKLIFRFLTPAPYSKFYTYLDVGSPGRIGQWIGYRIVHAYQKRTGALLHEVLEADAQEILKKSRYNP